MENVKVIAFDLDGTLTQHKSPLDLQNRNVLDKLSKKYKLTPILWMVWFFPNINFA